MRKKVIAFDLDDTLAITKSPIADRMSALLSQLLEHYDVCIISGGKFDQFKRQVVDRLEASPRALTKLHLMPTCGTRYYRYDELAASWKLQYAEDLSAEDKADVYRIVEAEARSRKLWPDEPYGDVLEDRGSQVTFSALGQEAPAEAKYAWAASHHDDKQALRSAIADQLPNLEVRLGGTTSIDITRIGIDKAYGMRKLLSALSLPQEDVLFIGDKLEEGGNDYPVKAMGIESLAVRGWEDTAYILEGILAVS